MTHDIRNIMSVDNLTKKTADFSLEITKDDMNALGFTGRFWSTSKPVSLLRLSANLLCEPRSFRESFKLAGIVGIKPLRDLAERLKLDGEMDETSYLFFCENMRLLDAFLEKRAKSL